MKATKNARDKRLAQFKKLNEQIEENNSQHLESLYRIIKDSDSSDLSKNISEAMYNYLEKNLSDILQAYRENYSSFDEDKIIDFNNLLYSEDGKTLEDRVNSWIESETDPQKQFYHCGLILTTESKHIISNIGKYKITTPYVEIIGDGECDTCSNHIDGNVYLEDEIELPPYHPSCTCEAIYYELEDLETDESEESLNI